MMDGSKLRIEDWIFNYKETYKMMLDNWNAHLDRIAERKRECLATCKTPEERAQMEAFMWKYEAEVIASKSHLEDHIEELMTKK